RNRREPRHGGGPGGERAPHLRAGVHRRRGARHHCGGADRADGRRLPRHADRIRHRSVRRGGDRRPRLDPRCACRRAHRRIDPGLLDRLLPGTRGARDLRDRHRGSVVPSRRPVRKTAGMRPSLAVLSAAVGIGALALVPVLAPPYFVNLLIPFFAYAIALLGFNLLFGYGGLLSFGHALFLGLGAYGAAVLAGVLGVRHFEIVVLVVAVVAAAVAVPIGYLCVRYVGIFFG